MIKEGNKIPELNLVDQDNRKRPLKEFRGKWLVLYAYPKDLTPGCTIEAVDFSSLGPAFAKAGSQVVGLSPDSPEKHCRFIEKKELSLILLSDPEHKGLDKLGAWGPKKFMGKEYDGVLRSTWLVDPEGKVRKIWANVRVKGHAREVLDTLKALQADA